MPRQSTATSKKIDGKPHKISNKSSVHSGDCIGSSVDRFQMISEAAYYHALGRGFNGGDPLEDWLTAESEINGVLQKLEKPGVQSVCS
jgi:hypothetical protein